MKKLNCCLLLLSGICFSSRLFSQISIPRPSQSRDTVKWVQIQNANKFLFRSLDSGRQLQILSGNVRMRQGNTYFSADSVSYNEQTLNLEAFGNVHIKDADSIDIHSQYLLYEGQQKLAHFKNKVRLTDGNSNLYTDNMDYDMNGKVGTYTDGGRIESNQTTLTSKKGYYYGDIKDVYFFGSVKMSDPEMTLVTDSLLYNTGSRVSTFIAPTTIKSGSSIIQTKEGFYDIEKRKAKFGGRTKIQDSTSVLTSNDLAFDDVTGLGEAKGNVRFIDTAQNILLYSNRVFFNKNRKNFLATDKPVMVVVQGKDSIFIASDTIYSGMIADLKLNEKKGTDNQAPNKIELKKNNTDSTRFITAFRNVKIFNDSLQAVGDSLFYSNVDSVFELYYSPVAWSQNRQISGDTILISTENKKPKKIHIIENALMIDQEDENSGFYNQIKARKIYGYFKDGDIDLVDAIGSAESIYYIKDNEQAYVGMNRSEADAINIYFDAKAARKIKYTGIVKGTTYPIKKIPETEKKLRNFKWLEARRPKSKWELFF